MAKQEGLQGLLVEELQDQEMEADKQLATISKRLLKGSGRTKARRSPGRSRKAGGSAEPLTDHEQIRQWPEERGGTPACVRGTGGQGDIGMLRLDFPGYSGEDTLLPISWDEWFQKFDERDLALLVQEKTGQGQKSNFNKLISRESSGEGRPKVKAAR